MPLYEYECTACGTIFQEISRFDAEPSPCPLCNSEAMRVFSIPHLRTDSTFLAGMSTNGSQFEARPEQGDYYKKVAEAHGQDTKGKVYLSGLAEFPGDPEAWVSGRGDVQRVAEARGYNVQGAVNVKSPREGPAPDPKAVDIADDLVARRMQQKITENPELAQRPAEELRAQVKQSMKPVWAKE